LQQQQQQQRQRKQQQVTHEPGEWEIICVLACRMACGWLGGWLNGLGGAKRVRCRTEVWLWHCIVVLIKNTPTELLARQKKQKQKRSWQKK